jgi:hypothetical protein
MLLEEKICSSYRAKIFDLPSTVPLSMSFIKKNTKKQGGLIEGPVPEL